MSAANQVTPSVSPPVRSLRRLALHTSAWTVTAYFVSQALRLGSNLILTRLLAPEAFGLMALVQTFLVGLHLFSDVGIGPSIVHHRRGTDPAFLNTAWTIQVVRGLLLAVGAALIAWPAALLYNSPELAGLIAVSGLGAIAQGFFSTALYTRSRELDIGRVVLLDLGTQIGSLAVTIGLAVVFRSVWVFVFASLFGTTAKAVLSHVVLGGVRNRFAWDRPAVAALTRFGRWVFVSSALSFVLGSADRLVLGFYTTAAELGVYSVALALAQPVLQLVQLLANRVFFPLYAQLCGDRPGEVEAKLRRLRRAVLAAALLPVSAAVVAAPWVVDLLYPAEYREAGWMLRVLAAGTVVPIIEATLSPIVLARGDSFRHMVLTGVRAAAAVGGMFVGGAAGGVPGLVVGYAAAPVLAYPVAVAVAYRRYGVWTPGLDLAAVAGAAGLTAVGLLVVG
ncbi:MAG: oligosaccharide flippase family protein [Gemmataceae bacterium]|nr:oligosaccharide flippase family protein [Gemmataceae bacterium]